MAQNPRGRLLAPVIEGRVLGPPPSTIRCQLDAFRQTQVKRSLRPFLLMCPPRLIQSPTAVPGKIYTVELYRKVRLACDHG